MAGCLPQLTKQSAGAICKRADTVRPGRKEALSAGRGERPAGHLDAKLGCGRRRRASARCTITLVRRHRAGWQELEALKRAAARIVKDETDQAPPPIVYHYASLDVAVKILNSFEMWCTNVAFSTDPFEGVHGEGVIDAVCTADPDLLMRGARKLVAEEIDGYATCFSVDADEDTKWRTYGANGTGVSIGFDVDVLSKRENVAFCRVEYDESQQKRVAKKLLDLFRGRLLAAKSRPPRQRGLAYVLTLSFVVLRARMKRSAYSVEREYRLLDALPKDERKHDTKLEYFDRGGRSVPFFRVKLRDSSGEGADQPIREVRVGPCLDFAVAESAIKNTVAYQMRSFPIRHSQVTLPCD